MDKGIIGLRNRGNTCYLNTSIQCLSHLPLLTQFFITNEHIADFKNQINNTTKENKKYILLTHEYDKLMKALWSMSGSIEPRSFHEMIQVYDPYFIGYEQQDSQEALSLIIDALHEGLKYESELTYQGVIETDLDKIMVESIENFRTELGGTYSRIVELFFGQYISYVVSLDNKKTLSKKFERFNNLSIPIYGKTLYDSLTKYFEKEILDDEFLDEESGEKVKSFKQMKMVRVPKYLVIFLKRYGDNLNKNNNSISFPINNLDLSHYCNGYDSYSCNMRLLSIGCHIGSLNGGHYYAVCRHINGNWYKYDDNHVSSFDISENRASLFKTGYILIYEKID